MDISVINFTSVFAIMIMKCNRRIKMIKIILKIVLFHLVQFVVVLIQIVANNVKMIMSLSILEVLQLGARLVVLFRKNRKLL